MKTAEQAIHDALWKYLAAKLPVYESRPMKDVGCYMSCWKVPCSGNSGR